MPGSLEQSRGGVARPRARTLIALTIAALMGLALLASSPSAQAAATQETIFQDDLLLLYSGGDTREETLDELKSLGVDTIRAFVGWSSVAPSPTSITRPGFDAGSPRGYSPGDWDRYDELVRSAGSRGMQVLMTPTGPIPAWASECSGSVAVRKTCSPNPTDFGRFVNALGVRYSGGYADENGGGTLPRVSRWAIWNEPNVSIWLSPQYVRRGRTLIPVAAARYRQLVYAAVGALRATGHGRDQVMAGETGPIGQSGGAAARRPIATAQFFRTLFCLTPRGGPLRSAAVGCSGAFRPLGISAIAHHPYVQGGSRSPRTPARTDEITLSSPSRLKTIVAQATRLGRIRGGLPIYYTEFGFQTDPPDETLGVQLGLQSRYLAESLLITFRDPRVRGLAQYLLRDDPGLAGFQSGLRFVDGRAKPSLRDFSFPVFVERRGRLARVFGQVRSAPDGARLNVQVQQRPRSGGAFRTVRTVTANPKGFVFVQLNSSAGTWRLSVPASPAVPDGLRSREAQEAIR